MVKRPDEMTVEELKVLWFDNARALDVMQTNQAYILDLINKRSGNEPEKKPGQA
jgi:hypothetical protein